MRLTKGGKSREQIPANKKLAVWPVVLLGLLMLYFLAFLIIDFKGMADLMTADVYSDTLAARYMWEKKSLFPEGWTFGNQFYIVATPVVSALFYGLTGSMNLSMALATTTMTILLLSAVYWLFHSFLDRTQALAGSVALVSSILAMKLDSKPEGQLLFTLASYYSCYLLTAIVVWGDYIQSVFFRKKISSTAFFLGLFLSFATGMQSIRQTCVMVVPLLAVEGARILTAWKRGGPIERLPALRAACVTAANLSGVLLIHLMDVPAVHIYGAMSFVRPERLPERFRLVADAVGRTVGLSYIYAYGPKQSWFIALFSLATIGAVAAALWRTMMRFLRRKAGPLEVLIALCVLSLLAVCISSLVIDMSVRSPYFFMWYFLVCLSVVSLLNASIHAGKRKCLALSLICALSVLNLRYSYAHNVIVSLRDEPYMSPALYSAAKVLIDRNVEILYGPTWEASLICAHTDGKVLCSPWNTGVFESLGYIYPQDLRDPEDNHRAAYLFLDSELEDALRIAEERGAVLSPICQLEGMSLYSSSVQLMQ